MGTVDLDVESTLKNRKFLSLLLLALLVTYLIPFPLISGALQDYSHLKAIHERMVKENDAIVCHNVLDTNPDFFSSNGMKCDDTYYRPNESTVSSGDLLVYEDTYNEYLRAEEALKSDIPDFGAFVLIAFLSTLLFSYAMVDFAVGLSEGLEKNPLECIVSSLRALPYLVAAEILVLIVLVFIVILLAILLSIFGLLREVVVGLIAAPAFALVVPAYYFTRNVEVVGTIWGVAKRNAAGYLALGAGLTLIDIIMAFQYNLSLGIWTRPLMILLGSIRYPLNSLGALKVYLDAEVEKDVENMGG